MQRTCRTLLIVESSRPVAGDLKRGHKGRAASCRPLEELRPDRILSLRLSIVYQCTLRSHWPPCTGLFGSKLYLWRIPGKPG
ncbi:hypothetical protein DPMN_178423 [Dreissena polymorpha]|uniref:Uncharacterized protein n=1 Tax=Dreissena polymorpha TaxID=45954 RepID=A0A9D4IL65_DREPO|nr:hypothetical protein DPMN_178423 [Dreissena polymorpha]